MITGLNSYLKNSDDWALKQGVCMNNNETGKKITNKFQIQQIRIRCYGNTKRKVKTC